MSIESSNDPDIKVGVGDCAQNISILRKVICCIKQKQSCITAFRHGNFKPSSLNLIRKLSDGTYSSIYLAKRIDDGVYYAIKSSRKERIRQASQLKSINIEKEILRICRGQPDFFPCLYKSFENEDYFFMVMEFAPGGDCLSFMERNGKISEKLTRLMMTEIIMAVQYLHSRSVIHRDIKPDNILISSRGHLQLADFGVATYFPKSRASEESGMSSTDQYSNQTPLSALTSSFGQDVRPDQHSLSLTRTMSRSESQSQSFINARTHLLFEVVGNFNYAAPEMIKMNGYDELIDWWAVGVMCYHFLTRRLPWDATSEEEVSALILNFAVNWGELRDCNVSPKCLNFVKTLLTSANVRCGGPKCNVLNHEWLSEIDSASLKAGLGPIDVDLSTIAEHPDQYFPVYNRSYSAEECPSLNLGKSNGGSDSAFFDEKNDFEKDGHDLK